MGVGGELLSVIEEWMPEGRQGMGGGWKPGLLAISFSVSLSLACPYPFFTPPSFHAYIHIPYTLRDASLKLLRGRQL